MILIITGRTASVPLNDFLKNKSHTRHIVFKIISSCNFTNFLQLFKNRYCAASCNYNMNKFRETNWCCNFTIFSNISKIALTIDELILWKSREINSCWKFTKFCGLIWNQIWYIFPKSIRDECYYIESISRCLNISKLIHFQMKSYDLQKF